MKKTNTVILKISNIITDINDSPKAIIVDDKGEARMALTIENGEFIVTTNTEPYYQNGEVLAYTGIPVKNVIKTMPADAKTMLAIIAHEAIRRACDILRAKNWHPGDEILYIFKESNLNHDVEIPGAKRLMCYNTYLDKFIAMTMNQINPKVYEKLYKEYRVI